MLEDLIENINFSNTSSLTASGQVLGTKGETIRAKIPNACLGKICEIELEHKNLLAQIVSFNNEETCLAPFGSIKGLSSGANVQTRNNELSIVVGEHLKGKVIDALGNPIASKNEELEIGIKRTIHSKPPCPLSRKAIEKQLITGVSGIDNLLSIGYGQRIGLFASAGVGKSTLLGMLARNADVDVCVIALVGERGREVKEFIDDCLGQEGLKRSVLVVATSDEPSIVRMTAPYTATTIAEYFRAQGKNVLLLVDSLTRMARAVREVSLSAGELPVRQGYTNSVFTELPKLLERAGNDSKGSITSIYTVLTSPQGDLDPLGDEIKSLLDGHIALCSEIASQGIRPAIDYTRSVSRLLNKIRTSNDLDMITKINKILYRLKKDKDILMFGGTADEELKSFLSIEKELNHILNQGVLEKRNFEMTRSRLERLLLSL